MTAPGNASSIHDLVTAFSNPALPPAARIVGVGGIGKTRVLDRIAAAAASRRRTVLRARGSPGGTAVPYGGLEVVLGRVRISTLTVESSDRIPRAALDAIWQALDELSAPVLLVDDVHWLDPASLQLLGPVFEQVPERGGSIVITYRPITDNPFLATLVAAAGRVTPPYVLRPLDLAGVREMLGLDTTDDRGPNVLADSGGIARWVGPAAAGEPVEHVVEAELAVLGSECRSVLGALAVLGAVPTDDLAAIVGTSEAQAAAALVGLRTAGLIEFDADQPVPVVAAAIRWSLPRPEQARMHLRLAGRRRERGEPAAVQAAHLAAAGATGAEASLVFEAAGDGALDMAPEEACTWYAHAVRAGADSTALAARHALAAARAERPAEALAHAEHVLRSGGGADVPLALAAEASAMAQQGWWERSATRYAQAAAQVPAEEAARFHACRVAVLLAVGDVDGAAAGLRTAESILPDTHPLTTDVAVTAARGLLDCVSDKPRRGLALITEAAELALVCRPYDLPVNPAMLAAAVAAHLGDFGVVEQLDGSALIGAWADVRRGRWREAADTVAGHRRRLGTGEPGVLSARDEFLALAIEAGLARRANDIDGLRGLWPRVQNAVLGRPVDLFLLDPAGELLVAAARLGAGDVAETLGAQTGALLDRARRPRAFAAWPSWHELELAVVAGDPERARSAANDLAQAVEVAHLLSPLVGLANCWPDVLAGRPVTVTVASAAREAETAGFRWEAARLVGGAAVSCDDAAATQELLALARELHRGLVPADGLHAGSVLSSRETEIGRLLIEGLTHREIGARLYLSPKTVEHQVAGIRQKLGVSSRSELLANLRHQLTPA